MLRDSQAAYINRMRRGDSLIRVGSIWYGTDALTTVPNIYYFGNKQMQTVLPVRAESAISFSTSMPPTDTIQIELVVNYAAFRTHVQRLCAQTQISPVLPVLNPAVAAIVQPVQTNKHVYAAYGFREVNDQDIRDSSNRAKLIEMYCSVPVQMRVDALAIETIRGAPRNVRILLRVARVLTSNIYGDRVQYVKTMEGALAQQNYIREVVTEGGDNFQIDAMASMLGVDVDGLRDMISAMQGPSAGSAEPGAIMPGEVIDIMAPDIYVVRLATGAAITVMPYGVECFNDMEKLRRYGLESLTEQAGLSGQIGASNDRVKSSLSTFLIPTSGTAGTGAVDSAVNLTVIERGPITLLDGVGGTATQGNEIHFCLINHAVLGDIGNTLLSRGEGFPSPRFSNAKVNTEYITARNEARAAGDVAIQVQLAPNQIGDMCPAAMVRTNRAKLPWSLRADLRGMLGR